MPSPLRVGRAKGERLVGEVTLGTFPPAMITFMRARIDEGATNTDIQREFGVSSNVAGSVRKCTRFNQVHLRALKKGLPDAFTTIAAASMSAITPDKLAGCSAPQLMMVAGIAYDKMRLALGESTANISFKDAGLVAVEALSYARNAIETTAVEPITSTPAISGSMVDK